LAEEPSENPAPTQRECTILRAYGFSDEDINDLSPGQREIFVKEALDAGIRDPKAHS
jgi:hypothetical protein